MHINIQGIQGKTDNLELVLDTDKPHIVCCTEHWQKASEITITKLNNYTLINSFCREHFSRGGSCIFAHQSLNLKPLKYNHSLEKHFEATVATYDLVGTKASVYIIVVYRTPDSDIEIFFNKMYNLLNDLYNNEHYYVICGDINVNMVHKTNDSLNILNLFNEFNMKCLISEPTRITINSQTCIDVVFSNIEPNFTLVKDTFISDHTYQICNFNLPTQINSSIGKTMFIRDLSDSNLSVFQNLLRNEKWLEMYNAQDFNEKFISFHSTLMFHYNNACCYRKIRRRYRSKQWFTDELKQLHQILCELHKLSKASENATIKNRYLQLKTIYKEKVLQAKKEYNNKRITDAKNIMKESWKIINESRSDPGNLLPSELVISDTKVTDKNEICDHLNAFFMDFQCPTPNYEKLQLKPNVVQSFFLKPTTPEEIQRLLILTTNKPAAGIDDVSGKALKAVISEISIPLSYLINESFKSGQYPDLLKTSKSIPIYKNKGSRMETCNYRNISVQSQLAKIFEMSYNVRLNQYLENYNLLPANQNGFRKNRSTSTAIAQLCKFIYEALNDKKYSIALFFDLSRAFDTIDHSLLLEKLKRIGVRGVANQWVASYLQERKQVVIIDAFKSGSKYVKTGVPQGSILGPLFFIIFTEDMQYACTTPDAAVVYADDTNLLVSDSNLKTVTDQANKSADEFHQWCQNNGLVLNVSKTFYTIFLPKNVTLNYSPLIKINHQSVAQASYIKFLGVIVDQKMTWQQHTENLSKKLSTSCFIIRYLRNTVSIGVLKLAYFGLVQSNLSYGLIFWGKSSHTNKIFIMQKRIIRCMVGVSQVISCKPIFISLSILTLPSLYIYLIIRQIREEQNLIRTNTIHSYNTRNNNEFRKPFSRLGVGQNSHIYQGIDCYNKFMKLFGHIENINNFNKFTNLVYKYLVDNAFYSVDEYLNS